MDIRKLYFSSIINDRCICLIVGMLVKMIRRRAMKNRKYTYKNAMPKAWRNKKSKRHKTKSQSPKDWRHSQNTSSRIGRPTLGLSMKQKQFKFRNSSSTWKLPSILFLASLITIILVITTLIVVPIDKDKGNESAATEKAEPEAEAEPESESESTAESSAAEDTFSVAVMRSNTEQIEDVSLENYVAGVVSSEMPADFEMEALKAQALTARTYIVNHLLHQDNPEGSNVTDTVQHQVYKNEEELRQQWGKDFQWKMDKVNKAVAATQGEIITYDNAPITPSFFSTSNGFTENSEDYWDNELPYLRSVKSDWDKDSPKYLDQQVFTIGQIESTLGIDLPADSEIPIEETRTKSKRISELKLADHTFSGRDIREKLELQSSDFTIEQKDNHLIFTTKGFGHGIGMSQYGANGMAKEGKKYEDIVNYYYQDIEVNSITETAPTLVAK